MTDKLDLNDSIDDKLNSETALEATEQSSPYQDILQQLINTSWQDYVKTINNLPAGYEIGASLKLLNIADQLLNQGHDFSQSDPIERYLIGGISDSKVSNHYDFNTELMGSMQNFASFKKLLRKDPKGLAKLLKIIPTLGPIDGWHFMQFVDGYKQFFADNGFKQAYVFPATRLLSMKRPDQFVALDASSAATFCHALKVKPLKNQEFQRYWDEIIVPLQKAPWFKMHQPMEPAEIPLHRSRFALIERLLCTPIETVEKNILTASVLGENGTVPVTAQAEGNTLNANKEKSEALISSADTVIPSSVANAYVSEQNITTDFNHYTNKPIIVKQAAKQPKKMTIAKKKSAKVNQAAATKLMSQYYFANKQKFIKVDLKKNREAIIDQLVEGESVENVFDAFLAKAES